jgi:hypothetical protein
MLRISQVTESEVIPLLLVALAAAAVGVPTRTVDVPSMTLTETWDSGPPDTISNCPDSARMPLFVGVTMALKRIR